GPGRDGGRRAEPFVAHRGRCDLRGESTAAHDPNVTTAGRRLQRRTLIGGRAGDEADVFVRRFEITTGEYESRYLRQPGRFMLEDPCVCGRPHNLHANVREECSGAARPVLFELLLEEPRERVLVIGEKSVESCV